MAYHHHHGEGHTACVRLVPIFNHLSDEQMDLIATSAHTKKVSKMNCSFVSVKKTIRSILFLRDEFESTN